MIDRTEAMTVVDVNTGKFTGSGGNLEQTVTRNNLEAAEEIVRQLRLRDIGGIIVIDFIDMVLESNRDLVLRRLTEALARDRTRHQVSEVTSLGLVQLTRKKLGTGSDRGVLDDCPHCAGRGIMLHGDPVDTAAATARASPSPAAVAASAVSGARQARAKKSPVAKVPAHSAGEHPMFKAMAAANGRHEDDEDGDEARHAAEDVAELDPDTIREAVVERRRRRTRGRGLRRSDEDETDDDESDDDDSDDDDDRP